jgi:bifunctional non-homologous end joining protein LigD
MLADACEGQLRLLTRNGRDATIAYPELQVLAELPDALLDGEVVALDSRGVPSFPVLAERMHVRDRRRAQQLARQVPVTYVVFDVLRLYGVDLTGRPFAERRATLEWLELPAGPVLVSPLYDDAEALLRATEEQGLEGVVAKRLSCPYEPGRRSPGWVKAAHWFTRTCLVGGWRPEVDTTTRIGALLVGAPDAEGRLHYLGRVGSGIGGAAQQDLTRLLRPLHRGASPFVDPVPAVDAAGVTWCEPQVRVEVRHLGWTSGGRLRQPSYRGIRVDVDADLLSPAVAR